MTFAFVDLFAGIGGFHAVGTALGGECVFASEIDPQAVAVYEANWAMQVEGDIVPLTTGKVAVPRHDLLMAGFPCQPFSKSGYQRGMDETRGTLFWNICKILEARKPAVILLENVRNLAGPRHTDTWATIVRTLRDLGYSVSGRPTVFSPHLLPPSLGGRPQVRERVFIAGTYVGRERARAEATDEPTVPNAPVDGWDPQGWDLRKHLPLQTTSDNANLGAFTLSESEEGWISIWEDLLSRIRPRLSSTRLPGFPIWADAFVAVPQIDDGTPSWKADFLRKNSDFYLAHKAVIDAWKRRHNDLADLPTSRRKLEWQAQDAASLWETVMHFRPSGIRAKRATYLPALVAITQTSVLGAERRRITPREAARLQGLPDWFEFGDQPDTATYRQLGNGVNVGAAYYVLKQHITTHAPDIEARAPALAELALEASENPDAVLTEPEGSSALPLAG